jgi:hypothetical protein
LIWHCFTLSKQQKVTASKYLKDLGHAVVERTNGDDIIQASSSEGIYDLTLGLSDKERRLLVSRGHDAAAITFGEAKEGLIEAHNFSVALSITSLCSKKGRGRGALAPPSPNLTLAQSVYSIGTSKVTNESEERSDDDEDNTDGDSNSKQVAIDSMDIVKGNDGQGAMLFSTASMEEEIAHTSKEERSMEEDPKVGAHLESNDPSWKEGAKEVSHLMAKMKKATTLLQLESDEEASDGSDFREDDLSVCSGNLELNLSDYEDAADVVSSGEFDANYVKKYANPKTFLHTLWNTAGPSARAMRICLEIIKEELQGQIAGVPMEFRDLPEQLINFMYEEAGEDPNDAITFITQIHAEIGKYDDDEEEEASESHVKAIQYDEPEPAPDIPNPGEGETQEASKTHRPLPRAQQTSLAEGAVAEPATDAGGDKEGVQPMRMAGSG